MESVLGLFREGGPSMVALLSADCSCCSLWVPAMLLGLVLRRGIGRRIAQVVAVFLLIGTLVPLVVGIAGWQAGVSSTDRAAAIVDPEYVAALRAVGLAEAEIPLRFGVSSMLGLLLISLLPALLAFRAEAEVEEEEEARSGG